jgi:ornithine--oxo-acid transaminase
MSTSVTNLNPVAINAVSIFSSARPQLLMCAPHLYDVDYVINPWMAGNVHRASRERAMSQWESLYNAVSQVAEVLLIEPQSGSPDMVFTANAGLLYNGQVAISSFFHTERQGEEAHFRRWFVEHGYKVLDVARETPFEGEGDALFSEDGTRLWVGHGPRTLESSHDFLREAWDVEVVGLELVDPRFYHLDTCFAPLEGGYAMYYPAAFGAASLREIEAFYPDDKRIVVEEADALRFACNAVNLGSHLILNRISEELSDRLRSFDFEVVQVELSEFLRAGGAAKCLVMKLGEAGDGAHHPEAARPSQGAQGNHLS